VVLLGAKIVLSAGFVLAITAAIERLGPRLGTLIAMVPQLAVLSLVFFAIEQGPAFAAESAFWNIPGMCATVPVFVGYLVASRLVAAPRWASITAGVAFGTVCFVVPAYLLSVIPMPRWAVVPFAAAVCFGTAWIVRGLPDTAPLRRVATGPLVLATRAGASVLTVLTVTALAQFLGPKWSGLVAGFPVNSLPVMVILHVHYGRGVAKPFIKTFPAGAFGICLFDLVAWLWLERIGLLLTVVLGYAVAIAYLAMMGWLRYAGSLSPSGGAATSNALTIPESRAK
jgi:hypothetical protein